MISKRLQSVPRHRTQRASSPRAEQELHLSRRKTVYWLRSESSIPYGKQLQLRKKKTKNYLSPLRPRSLNLQGI
jgi:hypothetical protein